MSATESQDPTLRSSISSSSASSLEPTSGHATDWIAPAKAAVEPRAIEGQSAAVAATNDSAEQSSGGEEEDGLRMRPGTERSSSTYKRISSATDDESTRDLWLRMVELQQRYGCYRSARMRAAASTEGAVDFMPSRICMDLLNEGLTTVDIPPEGWRILGKFVTDEPQETPRVRKSRWKVWKA
ncbi:hypothetical protein jhhlp_000452 [Lomentospora prolificans]|uniref:Uncharacterized protein n=1 Tax=Lomentospora prolificans TaxID=41688 RepID=A0A2N3NKZ8_9PEZI|nr:hypothetical protein jhhlp_000452 [Lomentospora prolificans]